MAVRRAAGARASPRFPAAAIALAKEAVDAADRTVVDGLLDEAHCFNLLARDDRNAGAHAALHGRGGQTVEVEKGGLF